MAALSVELSSGLSQSPRMGALRKPSPGFFFSATSTFSSTLSFEKRAGIWNVRAIPAR